jgi:hypothetical protein
VRQATALEIPQELLPGRLALPVAIPEAHQFFLALSISTNQHQNTMPRILQPGLQVHAIDPEIDVAFAREGALLPLRQVVVPPLLQPAQRGWGQPRRLGSQQSLESLGEIPRRDALEGEPGQQGRETFGTADRGGQECRMKAYPRPTAIPHLRHLHPDGTNACVDLACGERPVPDDGLPSLAIVSVRIRGSQQRNFHCNGLRQEPLGTLA